MRGVPDDRSYYFSARGVEVHPAVVLWVSAALVPAIAVGLVLELVFGALAAGKSAETQHGAVDDGPCAGGQGRRARHRDP